MHRRIPLTDPDDWRAALDGVPHAFAHTWGSCQAMQRTSGLETFLYRYEAHGVRVVCPFAIRRFRGAPDLLTPYGFSGFVGTGACPDFPARWAAYAAESGFVCGYVGLNPVLGGGWYDAADAVAFNSAFLLDLDDEAAMFARLSANRRRQVREWVRGGVAVVTDRARCAAFFAEHLRAFLDERRAARIYYLSAATLDALFALDDVLLLGAEVDGRLEAVSVFAHTPHVGDYLFNVSVPEGRRHSAPLIWEGALRLRARGIPVLNLGGGIRPGDGVAEFKSRFGPREVPLRSLRQIYDAPAFHRLCREAGVDASGSGYFPPYHAVG